MWNTIHRGKKKKKLETERERERKGGEKWKKGNEREVIGEDTESILRESVGNVGGRFFLVGRVFDCRPKQIGIDSPLLVEYLGNIRVGMYNVVLQNSLLYTYLV